VDDIGQGWTGGVGRGERGGKEKDGDRGKMGGGVRRNKGGEESREENWGGGGGGVDEVGVPRGWVGEEGEGGVGGRG